MSFKRKSHNGIAWYQFESLQAQGVVHGFMTRLGGASAPPFNTLNLGHTVGDDLQMVEENHRRALAALGVRHERVVTPHQVHGTHVQVVGLADSGTVQPATDGLLTATPQVTLLLRFADCVPLLLFDPVHRAVGLVHSGRQSTAGNIAGQAVRTFVERVGSDPADLWAGIGPAIGPCCYEVGPDVVPSITQASPAGVQVLQRRNDALYLDLPGLVRAQLQAAGVHRIEMANLCTACHTDEWFSHRAEGGHTGRFGALVTLRRTADL